MDNPREAAARIKAEKHAIAVKHLTSYFDDDINRANFMRGCLEGAPDNHSLARKLVTLIMDNFEQFNIPFDPEHIQFYVRRIEITPHFNAKDSSSSKQISLEEREEILRLTQGESDHDAANHREQGSSEYHNVFNEIAAKIEDYLNKNINQPFTMKDSPETIIKSDNINKTRSALDFALETNLCQAKTIAHQAETITRLQQKIEELLENERRLTHETQQLKAELEKREIQRLQDEARQEIQRLKEALAKPLDVLPVIPPAPRPKSPRVPWTLGGANLRDIRDMGPAPRDAGAPPTDEARQKIQRLEEALATPLPDLTVTPHVKPRPESPSVSWTLGGENRRDIRDMGPAPSDSSAAPAADGSPRAKR